MATKQTDLPQNAANTKQLAVRNNRVSQCVSVTRPARSRFGDRIGGKGVVAGTGSTVLR